MRARNFYAAVALVILLTVGCLMCSGVVAVIDAVERIDSHRGYGRDTGPGKEAH